MFEEHWVSTPAWLIGLHATVVAAKLNASSEVLSAALEIGVMIPDGAHPGLVGLGGRLHRNRGQDADEHNPQALPLRNSRHLNGSRGMSLNC
jgi:hypothetical protein